MRRALMLIAGVVALSPLLFVPAPEAQGQAIGVGTATLTWNLPTTYTNGAPLIVNQVLVYREDNDSDIYNLVDTIPGTVTTYIDDNLFNGAYCWKLRVNDYQLIESADSNIACKTINTGGNFPRPLAPSGLTVQ